MNLSENRFDLFNLGYIFGVLRKRYMWGVLISSAVLAVTVLISILSDKIYLAKSVILPVERNKDIMGVSSLVKDLGILNTPSSNAIEVVQLLNSDVLREKVILRYKLVPKLMGKKHLKKYPDNKERIWRCINTLRAILQVGYNRKDNIIILSVQHFNPVFARDLIQYALTELTDYMSSEAKRVAETNKIYLETLLDKNSDPYIKQKIYSLVAFQIETSMMSEVKENFAFKILDPPRVGIYPVKPNLKRDIALGVILSSFFSFLIIFGWEYIYPFLKKEKS